MLNKFRDLVTNGIEALFERFERQFRFVEWHYPIFAMAMLVALGVEYLGIALYRSADFPIWFGLVLFAVMLTAALWVSSKAAEFRSTMMGCGNDSRQIKPFVIWHHCLLPTLPEIRGSGIHADTGTSYMSELTTISTAAGSFNFNQLVTGVVKAVDYFGSPPRINPGDFVVLNVTNLTPDVFPLSKIVVFDGRGNPVRADGWGLELRSPSSGKTELLTPYSTLPVVEQNSDTTVFQTPKFPGLPRDKLTFTDKGARIEMTMEQQLPHRSVTLDLVKTGSVSS